MDITKLSETELKALAYDQLAQIELSQNNLKAINAEIQKRHSQMEQPAPEPTPAPTKEK